MRVPLEIFSVPEKGKATVRFLAGPRGILTHWKKPPSRACPGEEDCRDHERPVWKGYAPVQLWVQSEKHWTPVVLEMTEGLVEVIGTEDLRGKCFSVYRVQTKFGKQACSAKELEGFNSGDLPGPFDVVPPVERLYRTKFIAWDIPAGLFLRTVAEISLDPAPKNPPSPPPQRIVGPEFSFAENFRKNGHVEGIGVFKEK